MGMIFEWRVRSGSWEHEEGWKMTRRLGTIVSVLVFMHSFQGMEASPKSLISRRLTGRQGSLSRRLFKGS